MTLHRAVRTYGGFQERQKRFVEMDPGDRQIAFLKIGLYSGSRTFNAEQVVVLNQNEKPVRVVPAVVKATAQTRLRNSKYPD
jgi:hypothetical protein